MFLRYAAGAWLALASASIAAGCVSSSTSESETTCVDACQHLESCIAGTEGAQLVEDCNKTCVGLNFAEACRSVIDKASCAEYLSTSTLEQNDACFKPCDADSSRCLPDAKIEVCANGGQVVANCTWVCEQNDTRYTGTCGLMFQGQTSASGQPVCWCTT